MPAFGWTLFAVGVVTTPLPPPFAMGLVLVAAGLAILIVYSRSVRHAVRSGRRRYDWLNRTLSGLQARLPRRFSTPLRFTDPERHRFGAHKSVQGDNAD